MCSDATKRTLKVRSWERCEVRDGSGHQSELLRRSGWVAALSGFVAMAGAPLVWADTEWVRVGSGSNPRAKMCVDSECPNVS